jgi:hypothetical protein
MKLRATVLEGENEKETIESIVGINEIIIDETDLIKKRPQNEVVVQNKIVPLLGANLKKVEECDFLVLKRAHLHQNEGEWPL